MNAQSGLCWPIFADFHLFLAVFLEFLSFAERLGIEYGNVICRGHIYNAKEGIFPVSVLSVWGQDFFVFSFFILQVVSN